MKIFNNIRIRNKIGIAVFVILTFFGGINIFLNISSEIKNTENLIKESRNRNYDNAKERLKTLVDTVSSGLVDKNLEEMSEFLSKTRYDNGTGYFWLNDFTTPYTIMKYHPILNSLIGKEFKDEKYNLIGDEKKNFLSVLADDCNKNGEAYIEYLWPKPGEEELQVKLSYAKKIRPDIMIATGFYVEDLNKVTSILKQNARVEITKSIIYNVTTLILLLIISIVFIEFILISITKNLKKISDISYDLVKGTGDLTIRLNIESGDETGVLSKNFDLFLTKLAGIILSVKENILVTVKHINSLMGFMNDSKVSVDEINDMANDVKSLIDSQSQVVTDVTSTIEEIARTIQNQDERIISQSASVNQSSAAIEEMIANIKSIGNNLNNSSKEFDTLHNVVRSGNDNINLLKEMITELQSQSDSVLDANNTIKNIASQTNLLAMNAAIEAAHAGDYGKGFSVVADEIRKLSEVSNDQSKVITENLGKLKKSIESAVQISTETEDSFSTIVKSVEIVTNLEKEIKNSLDEQASGSVQVLEALNNISQITEIVHSGSNEMLVGSKDVIKKIVSLVDITEKVKKNSDSVVNKAGDVKASVNKSIESLSENIKNLNGIEKTVSVFKG